MLPLAELYPVLTQNYLQIPEVQQGIVRIAWNYCVGESIRKISEPRIFENGILHIEVPHSQWQTTLSSIKPEIISRMNKYVKRTLVKDLQIEVR